MIRAVSLSVIGLLAFAVGLAQPDALAQHIIHVSTEGDDSADGSADHPLRSLDSAQEQVRKYLSQGGNGEGVRVEIASGTYFLTEPLYLASEDSGPSPTQPVIYAASRGEVVISGGMQVTGWRQSGSFWTTSLSSVSTSDGGAAIGDLWVNGQRAIRARSPNKGFFRIERAGPDDRTGFVVAPKDLLSLRQPYLAEVTFLHDWSMSRVRLDSVEAATRTYRFKDPIGASPKHYSISHFEPHPRYFVENARELFDAPGEWYHDLDQLELQYYPRIDESFEQTVLVFPRLERLVELRGTKDQPVENIRFEGLTFSHTLFRTSKHGYAGSQATKYQLRANPNDQEWSMVTSAVLLDRTRQCQFTNCRFEHLGGSGLHVSRSSDIDIKGSAFRDVGGNAVMIGSTDAKASPITQDITLKNCLIEECGQQFLGAVGIWIGFARACLIEENEIQQLPYTGISVGWQWNPKPSPCGNLEIRSNHIHHVMQILSDGGGIYTLGRQPRTRLAENRIHDIPAGVGRAESNGIFMDQGSAEIVVEGNSIYNVVNSPIRFNEAKKNTVARNQLVAQPGVPFFKYRRTDSNGMTFVDNELIIAEIPRSIQPTQP